MKIDDLQNTINEVDNIINRSHTLNGQILSIRMNENNYICQGCGGMNLIDEPTFISCNDCHS
jgi:Zn finger protein HypA/HybF involved in hydrogenase expression